MNEYWSSRVAAAVDAAKGDVSIEALPIRSNETSDAFSVRFNGVGEYPLYAYLHVPKTEGPHVPLFQAPGYGSVVAVPAYERRATYVVMALCHRGQRLSTSGGYNAAYPGLLTDGLPGADTYVWGDVVSDCITAVQILLQQPYIDASRLAISGGDMALLTASLIDGVHALQTAGLMFADVESRMKGDPDYPIAEFNDFKRSHPNAWGEATATLANYDPLAHAGSIDANKVMLSTSASEKGYYDGLASKLSGETFVRVNLGKGHLDHIAQEEWLADACGVEPGPAHYPRP